MKYVVFLGDGMADIPIPELNNKTPLDAANKPMMDFIASHGEIGMVKTVPDGIKPGSDVANLSVMGFNPIEVYTGRSPLEAYSIGVSMSDSDTSFRCNLVTVSDEAEYSDKVMIDYSSDEITSEEAAELIKAVNEAFRNDEIEFHAGISYRHLLLWHGVEFDFRLTPPHDITGKPVRDYLPNNPVIADMMKKSYDILKNHPVNFSRIKNGKNPANSIWIWGEGKKPALPLFEEKTGLKGSMISAVDLLKGIAIAAGMRSIDVEGATGNIDTNFSGKADAAISELKSGQDFVYIHVEAPDESGHRNELDNKVKSIELIDSKIIKPVMEYLENCGEDYKVMVLPDHPTPIQFRTHTSDPVPFAIYDSRKKSENNCSYTENDASGSDLYIDPGHTLMKYFIS